MAEKPERQVFHLPQMTKIEEFIRFFDYLRIPECLELYRLHPSGNDMMTAAEKEAERQVCLQLLKALQAMFEANVISAEDYQRLTTPQNHSAEQQAALRERVVRFKPELVGILGDGRRAYQLLTDEGWIALTLEDGKWYRLDRPPIQL
jgi:hypothetical protein